jgi:hypothetical protein
MDRHRRIHVRLVGLLVLEAITQNINFLNFALAVAFHWRNNMEMKDCEDWSIEKLEKAITKLEMIVRKKYDEKHKKEGTTRTYHSFYGTC